MSEEEHTLLLIRGSVASLSKEQQDKVRQVYDRIRGMESEIGSEAVLRCGVGRFGGSCQMRILRILILILVLITVGCTVRVIPGDRLTQKAQACIDAGMEIRVLEIGWNNDTADIVCVLKGTK